MEQTRKKYTYEERLSFLREYHESDLSKNEFAKLHGFCGPQLITQWEKRYSSPPSCVSLQPETFEEETMANKSKEEYRDEIKSQQKRIKELEKALEFSRLETRVRDMMIDRAEEYYNIQIRKKSGAK